MARLRKLADETPWVQTPRAAHQPSPQARQNREHHGDAIAFRSFQRAARRIHLHQSLPWAARSPRSRETVSCMSPHSLRSCKYVLLVRRARKQPRVFPKPASRESQRFARSRGRTPLLDCKNEEKGGRQLWDDNQGSEIRRA